MNENNLRFVNARLTATSLVPAAYSSAASEGGAQDDTLVAPVQDHQEKPAAITHTARRQRRDIIFQLCSALLKYCNCKFH